MRKYLYLAYDLACICGALVAALYLRHGIPLIQEGQPQDLYLILLVTLGSALLVLPILRTNTRIWRFTSSADLANIMLAVAIIVLLYNSSLFFISRLHMMPRSVPPMHWALAVFAMGGTRVVAAKLFGPTRKLAKHVDAPKQHVIVVGACYTAELYLQFVKRILQHQVVVEGFVDSDPTLTQRLFQKHRILGTPANLSSILEEFNVHGIHIHQIVLAQPLDDLPEDDRTTLRELERAQIVELVHFGKHMGPQLQPRAQASATDFYESAAASPQGEYKKPAGYYPYVKRAFDIVFGIALLIALWPLFALTCILVLVDVGMPLIFWQQRPGLHGKPFHLYKFRTMRHAGRKLNEDRLAHKSGDTMRMSIIGKWLRRLRWDEMPQLVHIIVGTMSFVGPRPLLPDDQPVSGQMRLSVRPGVTGWAQIHGGDALSPEKKLELDLWYIQHMSFWLDLRILLRTLLVVLKEDKRIAQVFDQAQKTIKKASRAHEQL